MRIRILTQWFASVALLAFTSCWPGGPIAAVAASGGGGGGSSAIPNTNLGGTIIVGATTLLAANTDNEPNDCVGGAIPIDTIGRNQAAVLQGTSGFEIEQLLIETNGHGTQLRQSSWFGDTTHQQELSVAEPKFVAVHGQHLVLLSQHQNVVLHHRIGPTFRHFAGSHTLPIQDQVVGFAANEDLLLILTSSEQGNDLYAVDPVTLTQVHRQSWPNTHWRGLAAGRNLTTGKFELFTTDEHTVMSLDVVESPTSMDIGAVKERWHLPQEVISETLVFNGLSLVALTNDRQTLISFDADLGHQLDTQALANPTSAFTCRARTDLDGHALRLPANDEIAVRLIANTRQPRSMFIAAIDRSMALRDPDNSLLFFEWVDAGGRSQRHVIKNPEPQTRIVDLVVGAMTSAVDYEILVNQEHGQPRHAQQQAAQWHQAARPFALQEIDALTWLRPYFRPELRDHVPGRLIVGSDSSSAYLGSAKSSGFELQAQYRSPSGADLVTIAQAPAPRQPMTWFGEALPSRQRLEDQRQLLQLLLQLERDPSVHYCEPDYRVRVQATTPKDPLWDRVEWAHDAMRVPRAWDEGTGSANTVVAVVDSGIRTENTDLTDAHVGGFDFVSEITNSGDGDGLDADPYDEGDYVSHGTHVAGSIGATGNNGIGIAGVMWNSSLLSIRAIGTDGTGSIFDIAEAIRYSAGLANVSGSLPATSAAVINLSLGTTANSSTLKNAVDAAESAGALLIAAAGNDGLRNVLYPAKYGNVVAIAASNSSDARASYSNYGPEIDVTVPGGDLGDTNNDSYPDLIYSTIGSPGGAGNGEYAYLAGTSMACALASGAAALIWTANPALSADEIACAMINTARDTGLGDDMGSGIVHVANAIDEATPLMELPLSETDFGQNGSNFAIQISNGGGGTLQLNNITITPLIGADANWLSIDQAEFDNDGTILLSIDRTGYADGAYRAQVSFETNGGDGNVVVEMTVSSAPLPDVGVVTIELRDANNKLIKSTTTNLGESYEYLFKGFKKGSYKVHYGVDLDDDGTICEVGEPCNQYPNPALPDFSLVVNKITQLSIDLLLE